MKINTRIFAGIVAALAIVGPSQAFKLKDAAAGVVVGQDGLSIIETGVHEVGKHEFLKKLHGKQNILLTFYEEGKEESDKALKALEAFAERAASRYPDLYIGKVNCKANPYLTARLLLTGIPELRLVVKDQEGKWAAYNPEIAEGTDELVDYMDNQQWYLTEPVGGKQQMYCSPFNFCGKLLAVIADKGSVVDQYIPLPRWLAVIVLPALITVAGRFIIEGMYAAENRVRGMFRWRQQPPAVNAGDENSKQTPQAKSSLTKEPEGKKTR